MRVIVTGAHGFLGHHVCRELLAGGHEVVAVDRVKNAISDKAARIAAFERLGGAIRFAECDLSNWKATRDLVRKLEPEAIFHGAGQYSVKYTTENLMHYIRGNLCAPLYVFEAARLFGVPRIVYASSASVSDAGRPSGLYGATKAFNEHAAHAYVHRTPHLSAVGIRYGVLYGPLIRRDTDFFKTVRAHLRGEMAKPGSQFDKRAPMVYIDDAAALARRALEAPIAGALVFPGYADDPFRSYREVLETAAELTGRPVLVPNNGPERGPGARPDLSALERVLGWVPRVGLREGLARYLQWATVEAHGKARSAA